MLSFIFAKNDDETRPSTSLDNNLTTCREAAAATAAHLSKNKILFIHSFILFLSRSILFYSIRFDSIRFDFILFETIIKTWSDEIEIEKEEEEKEEERIDRKYKRE